jgi:hypothetical protein
MPRPTGGLIEVQCPCCEATLKIDAETRTVISHKEKPRPKTIEDIESGVARLKQEAVERDQKFNRSMEEQKTRQQVLSKKFDELFKQAKESPDTGPRHKDIDLD